MVSTTAHPSVPWEQLRNRALTIEEKKLVREFYSHGYHDRCEYTEGDAFHQLIAYSRVRLAQAVFRDLGKVLDAGCAAGAEVLAFRRQGVDAWGFDLCPDLPDVAYEEAVPFVRVGRLDHIPYSASDGFKTLVSYDVFEHVPIDCLERFPEEIRRLGITQVACIISADTISDGHITIQDLEFYEDLMSRAGLRLATEITDRLQEVQVPVGRDPRTGGGILAPYTATGEPRNGWNAVPGHLFFVPAD